jgi:thioesterase domain-containing protein
VTDRAILCNELTTTLHRDIPLAAAMNVGVESFDGLTLTVRAPLPPNRNVHGTAFAGSLYSICVLTGWGTTWLAWREQGLVGVIVVAASTIQYRKAVTGALVCRCTPNSTVLHAGFEQFTATGRASLDLECTIDCEDKNAVAFTGTYVVHAKREVRLARRAD